MLPKVSVTISTYNRANFLKECLDSVLSQTYPNIEIIIVDDGSTDNTEAVVSEYKDKVKYIKQHHQGGMLAHYNARSFSTGEYLTYFGDDDVLYPDFIERGVNILESDLSIAKVFTDCHIINSEGKRVGNNSYLHHYKLDSGLISLDTLLERGCVVHGGIDRRSIFAKVNDFDTNFPHAADFDLYLRITGGGYSIYFVNEPLWSYRVHPKMRSHNETEMWEETIKVLELNLQRFPEAKKRLNTKLNRKLGMNKAWLAVRLFWEKEFSKSFSYALSATKNYLPAVPLGALQMTYSALKNKRSVYQLGD